MNRVIYRTERPNWHSLCTAHTLPYLQISLLILICLRQTTKNAKNLINLNLILIDFCFSQIETKYFEHF